MEGRLRQSPLPAPVISFAGDQTISQQAPEQAVVPAARIILLVVIEDPPNVVRMIEEVDERPNTRAKYIAELLACPKLIGERIAQELS